MSESATPVLLKAKNAQVETAVRRGTEAIPVSYMLGCVRASPRKITQLAPDEVFVFGSNARGRHRGGAARFALNQFGAVDGEGHGLRGQSYAIDSMSGIDVLRERARSFLLFAQAHPGLTFLVTEVGCGIAGHTPQEVAPLFASPPSNVRLPQSFIDILETCSVPDVNTGDNFAAVMSPAEHEAALIELLDGLTTAQDESWPRPADAEDLRRLAALDDPRLLEEIARRVLLPFDGGRLAIAGYELLTRALYLQGRLIEAAQVLEEAEEHFWQWIDLGSPAHRVQLAWLVRSQLVLEADEAEPLPGDDPDGAYHLLVQSANKALWRHTGWDRGYLLMALCRLADFDTSLLSQTPDPLLARAAWARLALRLPKWNPKLDPGVLVHRRRASAPRVSRG
ncbi:hypothetical protein [Tessaracoccus sp. MC1627]|uniref:A1S_2505 family phage non-structural protein n=1 Tax=Tessaracoccus sp. MC1627 TaxID=2760312 RepID=UPI001C7203B1|nr:hypothetical protein [Tessaracoccus sp. MC1627]